MDYRPHYVEICAMSSLQLPDIGAVFGEVLKHFRSVRGISQEELALLSGLDRTFVSRLERGIRQPTLATLIGIGLALEVSAAELVKETERQYLRQAGVGGLPDLAALILESGGSYLAIRKRQGDSE